MDNILYKYLDINGAIMMLYHRSLMYANATTFNDPFDCHPSLIDCSNVPAEECNGWPANVIEELHSNKLTNNRKDLWICCLSKLYDSLLMWSYYNKHEGVCIGLNMDYVEEYLNIGYGRFVSTKGKPVKYIDIINKPDFYQDQEEFFDYQVFTKAKAWEHEQEVRLFIYKPSHALMKLLPFQKDKTELQYSELRAFITIGAKCFDSLYWGLRVNAANKEKISRLARSINPDIKICQMEADPNTFRLIDKH